MSRPTVRLLFSAGRLSGFTVGKSIRIYRWSVESYIRSTSNVPPAGEGVTNGR